MPSPESQPVVIVGAGPTGLMLAGELALAGVRAVVIERRPDQTLSGSRALGISSRTIEVLDQRGIADRFLAAGQTAQLAGFALTRLDLSDLCTRHPYGLALRQQHIERLLAAWVAELGVEVRYGHELTDSTERDEGVDLTLTSRGTTSRLRCAWLVGCDGGRSVVRRQAGIELAGWDATTSNLLAEVEMTTTPPYGVHRSEAGTFAFGRREYTLVGQEVRYKEEGPITVMLPDPQGHLADRDAEPTLELLRERLLAVCGDDYGVHSPTWISRFTDASRQAVAYRRGRVLLAGDAAHVHSPIGGMGLGTGVQDAVNLGWKLGLVARGLAPEALLDSYHAERHPVGARVLQVTMAQVALHREDARTRAAREIVGELLQLDGARRQLAGVMSGLDIRYDLGPGHPLLGRRMPDLDLQTPLGARRVYSFLHAARPLLLHLGGERLDPGGWSDRVLSVAARCDGPWEFPVIGRVEPPRAVLVRPDGHVAWVGEPGGDGLSAALRAWVGEPAAATGLPDDPHPSDL